MWTIILQCRVAANLQFVWMCVLISLGNIHISQVAELHDCCLVTKWCLPLYKPMDCSTPVSPVLDYLPEFAQIHVCWVGDAIQLSHPLPPSSPFAFNLSQHQGLFPLSWLFASGGQSTGASTPRIYKCILQGYMCVYLQYLASLGIHHSDSALYMNTDCVLFTH